MKKIVLNKWFIIPLIIVLLVALAIFSYFNLFSDSIWDKRIKASLVSTDCVEVEDLRYGEKYYSGPLIDTHYHIASIPDSPVDDSDDADTRPVLGVNVTIGEIDCTLIQENIKKVFAFFPVYPGMEKHHIDLVDKTMKKYPERFVSFIMPPDDDNSPDGSPTVDADMFKEMLSIKPNLFEGYGEIGLYARDGGSPELRPDSDRLNDIYPILKDNDLVAYFHLEKGQEDEYMKVISENPDINFIFHGDQLIPDVTDNVQNLTLIEKVISSNPNVFYTIDELYGDEFLLRPELTKENFLKHLENYEELLKRDLASWKWIIEKYPNQFLWGTDRGPETLWSYDPETGLALTNYARAFIANLDPLVQENFAYKNAERLLEN